MSSIARGKLPPVVYAQASVRSIGGRSLFESLLPVTSQTVANFYSDLRMINRAAARLIAEGFKVLQISPITINIAAPAEVYEKVFNTSIVAEEKEVNKGAGGTDTATFLNSPETRMPGLIDTSRSPLADLLEGVALEEPKYFFLVYPGVAGQESAPSSAMASPSALSPQKEYWHLDVPAGVSLGLNADRAHRAGITGLGINLAMVDSGWYRHPFFVQRGYRSSSVVPGPATTDPDHDESGHGTGESANIFAIAPDTNFTMVKTNFVNTIGSFNTAVELRPDIISCSWGLDRPRPPLSAADQALAAAVAHAVKQGIIVVFSAGNGHWGFPGQHPDVISAGGAYMLLDGSVQATEYASGFKSILYPGRIVPDVCGLVGLPPNAQYIMLPVEPNDDLDSSLAGGSHPEGDQTAPADGWAAFSGTSAAAPQLAGVSALIKQACPGLSPEQVRQILRETARDVSSGCSSPRTGPEDGSGHPATQGPDTATGYGLADAYQAVMAARARCATK